MMLRTEKRRTCERIKKDTSGMIKRTPSDMMLRTEKRRTCERIKRTPVE